MPTIDNSEFYREQKEHSLIKSCIVSEYFLAWAKIMIAVQKRPMQRSQQLAYIDLFCGPGKYEDGTESTPLLIMRQVLSFPELRDRLITVFNDREPDNTVALEKAFAELEGIEQLKFKPQIFTGEVDESVVKQLEAQRLPPTFLFVDPWGYKGLSLRLINSVLRHWGCDCVFFFNYNRVNAGMGHKGVKNHLDEIFGEERANRIRQKFAEQSVKVGARESFIVDEMKCALEEMGGKYVLPFRFRDPQERRTTHHLFFVSKEFLGYKIMREIMHAHSHKSEAVARFEYNPADASLPSLFNLLRPLSDLEDMLLADCAGRTFVIEELFKSHSVGKPFVLKEYKDVLCRMEKEGKVSMEPPHDKRKQNTLGEKVKITFPARSP
jgi:three-Cys-motif partner protein